MAWQPGERVRFYQAAGGVYVWLPDETDDTASMSDDDDTDDTASPRAAAADADAARDYDVAHYQHVLHSSYVSHLRKAFAPAHFDQLFRQDGQLGLFDAPLDHIAPHWIRCAAAQE